MELIDLITAVLAALTLAAGLLYKWHKNNSIFLFSLLMAVSTIVNPILFIANEDMYGYAGWNAVGSFNFTLDSLINSYSGSNFICILILTFSLLLNFSLNQNRHPRKSHHGLTRNQIENHKPTNNNHHKQLIIWCIILIIIYYPLYNGKIGVTGLPGELPFRLSGIVHYIRTYFIPILLVILLNRVVASRIIYWVYAYAFFAGISSASRFVGLLPIILLIMYLIKEKKYFYVGLSVSYMLLLWFSITASRDLTFDGGQHDLFEVAYYSITNLPFDDIVNTFDLLTGRLSGAQQIVLVNQFRGHEECDNIAFFLLGLSSVCVDVVGTVYGLDLSGTTYGIGLGMVPSIVISGTSTLDYIIPSIFVSLLLYLTQSVYKKVKTTQKGKGVEELYLILSILFIFLGQILFFYYLQAVILIFSTWRLVSRP